LALSRREQLSQNVTSTLWLIGKRRRLRTPPPSRADVLVFFIFLIFYLRGLPSCIPLQKPTSSPSHLCHILTVPFFPHKIPNPRMRSLRQCGFLRFFYFFFSPPYCVRVRSRLVVYFVFFIFPFARWRIFVPPKTPLTTSRAISFFCLLFFFSPFFVPWSLSKDVLPSTAFCLRDLSAIFVPVFSLPHSSWQTRFLPPLRVVPRSP